MTAAATVRERPILFSGAMVRAILDGTKTQTRRVVKVPADVTMDHAVASSWDERAAAIRGANPNAPESAIPLILGPHTEGQDLHCNLLGDIGIHVARSPYGRPGDRLWVRETWFDNNVLTRDDGDTSREELYYRADGEFSDQFEQVEDGPGWRPSIHMPRWASRITLELTGVRVEHVQDISEDDARAEGSPRMANVRRWDPIFGTSESVQLHDDGTHRCGYRLCWNILNAARGYGWDVNPWVWVLEFRRLAA